MSRIFTTLTIVATLLLCISVVLGLRVGKYNELYRQYLRLEYKLKGLPADTNASEVEQLQAGIKQIYTDLNAPRDRARLHMLIGILAGLVALLVNCISVTYFIGTSRWCKEVAETYQLSTDYTAASTRLKRKSFPFALLGIMLVMLIAGLGAAADPGTLRESTPLWVQPHLFASLFGSVLIVIAYMFQIVSIRENSAIVDQILAEVQKIRQNKGLDQAS